MRRKGPALLALVCALVGAGAHGGGNEGDSPPQRQVVITIDDVPLGGDRWSGNDLELVREVNSRLLKTLTEHQVPAIGFVNESKLWVPGEVDARIAVLNEWLDAGMALGNHTFSHLSLQRTPLDRYQDNVIQGEVVTRRLLKARGTEPRYFRHPYTSTGPTAEIKAAFEAYLAERGYKVAPITVDHADYMFNAIYVRARQSGDKALEQRVRQAYLDHLDTMFAYFEKLSMKVFGYEIKQAFLIHANEINAELLDEMLRKLEQRGYVFVSMDEAFTDPAYGTEDGYVGPSGLSWLHRWAVGKGTPVRVIRGNPFPVTIFDEPEPPKFILEALQGLD